MFNNDVQKPSFVLIDVQGSTVVTYSYVLEDGVSYTSLYAVRARRLT